MIKQTGKPLSARQKEALCRRYCRQVKHHLPCSGTVRKPILNQLRESVFSYLEEHSSADLKELYTHFGTPEDFASNVLENLDGKQLQGQMHHYRRCRVMGSVVLGLALAFGIFYCADLTIDRLSVPTPIIIENPEETAAASSDRIEGPIPSAPPIDSEEPLPSSPPIAADNDPFAV